MSVAGLKGFVGGEVPLEAQLRMDDVRWGDAHHDAATFTSVHNMEGVAILFSSKDVSKASEKPATRSFEANLNVCTLVDRPKSHSIVRNQESSGATTGGQGASSSRL